MPRAKAKEDPEKAEAMDDDEEEELEDEEEGDSKALVQNPALIQALQGKLATMVGRDSGYIKSLPAPVKRRLKALKKLQFESIKVESEFYKEVHALEIKYYEKYKPQFEQRAKIVSGDYEPGENECEWKSDTEDEEEEEESKEKKEEEKPKEEDKDVKGVPEFWLTIFKNLEMTQDMIQEHDEPAMRALRDITVSITEKPVMGFTLFFHFDSNEYFSNNVLEKWYELRCDAKDDDPFDFEGPEIVKCKGCKIDWLPGKNLTVKTVKKKQKHKAKGSVRTVTKTVKNDSFFNFFDPPPMPIDDEDIDEDTEDVLTADFEIGHTIKERLIPRAVLYFTGEALEVSDFEDDDEDDEDDDDEDDEDDPDFDGSAGQRA